MNKKHHYTPNRSQQYNREIRDFNVPAQILKQNAAVFSPQMAPRVAYTRDVTVRMRVTRGLTDGRQKAQIFTNNRDLGKLLTVK